MNQSIKDAFARFKQHIVSQFATKDELNSTAILYNVKQSLTEEQQSQAKENIGAIGIDDIPTTLPNPKKLTIDGTEYDGSEEITITLPKDEWTLLNEGELTEALTTITINTNIDSSAFTVEKLRIELLSQTDTETAQYCDAYILINGSDAYNITNGLYSGIVVDTWMEFDYNQNHMLPTWYGQSYGEISRVSRYMSGTYAPITSIEFGSRGELSFATGTKYRIYYR